MSIAQLLAECHSAGLTLRVSGDGLALEAAAPPPTSLLDRLKAAKPALLDALKSGDPLPTVAEGLPETARPVEIAPSTCTDDHAERAAIVEYGAVIPREWAEGSACLDPDKPPDDVPLKRWQQFVDDCGRFLDSGWPERAKALGWGPMELFGADRRAPFARIDRAGLLWLLDGRELVAMSDDAAGIACPDRKRQSYRRLAAQSGCVLPWELAR